MTAGTLFGNGAGITGITAGKLLKKSFYTITRQSTSQASFPNDDTAPQIDEGIEIFSQAYTPSTANCDLFIFCTAGIRERSNVADDVGMALFISDNTSALRVVTEYCSASVVHGANLTIAHKMPSWGASAKTFLTPSTWGRYNKYFCGTYNGVQSSPKMGATTHASLFIIEEIATY